MSDWTVGTPSRVLAKSPGRELEPLSVTGYVTHIEETDVSFNVIKTCVGANGQATFDESGNIVITLDHPMIDEMEEGDVVTLVINGIVTDWPLRDS